MNKTTLLLNKFEKQGVDKKLAIKGLKINYNFSTKEDIENFLVVRGVKNLDSIVDDTIDTMREEGLLY